LIEIERETIPVSSANIAPSLVERLQQAWVALVGKPDKPETLGVVDASNVFSHLKQWEEVFSISGARQERYADFDKMDVGYVHIMLNQMVQSCLTFEENEGIADSILSVNECFKIQLDGYGSSGPKKVIEQVLEDTQLREQLPSITRDVIKYGDDFVELIVDNNQNIVDLFPHYARDIIVHRDIKGRLERGVDQNGIPLAYQQTDGSRVVAGWYPDEMLHVKYAPSRKSAYSLYSFLDPMRASWRKVDWIEQAMVVARITRAYPRLVHKLDLTNKSNQEAKRVMGEYVKAFLRKFTPNNAASKTPHQPDEDYFIGNGHREGKDGKLYQTLNDINLLDPRGDAFVANQDINHFLKQLFSQVPGENLGLTDQRIADLTGQDVALANLVSYIQNRVLEKQLIRPVIDNALLLKGYRKVNYTVSWPSCIGSQSWRLADAQFRLALAARTWLEMRSAPRSFLLKRIFNLTTDQAEELLNQVEKDEKRFGLLNPGDKTAQQAVGNTSSSLDKLDPAMVEMMKEIIKP
jgi:hypothetical protein